MALLPRSNENNNKTQGKYGALKLRTPKKLMRIKGFLRLHM